MAKRNYLVKPPGYWRRELGFVLLSNLLISCLLYLLSETDGFFMLLIYANCVGFSSVLLAELLLWLAGRRLKLWQAHLLALPPGLLLGLTLASFLGYPDALAYMLAQPLGHWRTWALCLMLGCIAAGFALSRYQTQSYRAQLERQRRQVAEYRQADIQARLRLLQAQIEPHFLFNTLANAHSLVITDPPLAQQMLSKLDSYLRASLQRTRGPLTTLKQELELITNLLDITQIRLGKRLTYQLQVDEAVLTTPLPPLLLQPLVENALYHGIEPLLQPGTLVIEAIKRNEQLLLRVLDNGVGLTNKTLSGPATSAGIGLANVRQRLLHLYGQQAYLRLYANHPCGCIAELSVPLCIPPAHLTNLKEQANADGIIG